MADVLIKGIKMPEYCYECPCHNGESGYCQAYKSGYLYSIERPAKCPLVPLPEGHGRLGDLDALMKKLLTKEDGRHINDRDSDGWPNLLFVETVRTTIEDALTIVPAEGGSINVG